MAPQRPKGAGALETDNQSALSPAPVPPRSSELYAALDLGTNSCRMLIAQPRGSGFHVVDSFSKSVQLGAGLEYSLADRFMVRAAYKYDLANSTLDPNEKAIYSGLSAGVSLQVPLSKENKDTKFGIDYAYRHTRLWSGTHNIGVRISILTGPGIRYWVSGFG